MRTWEYLSRAVCSSCSHCTERAGDLRWPLGAPRSPNPTLSRVRGCRSGGVVAYSASVTQEAQLDVGAWVGKLEPGHQEEHANFRDWLRSDEAADIFRRRRLTGYDLYDDGASVVVVLRAPHTGDPRLMVDALRYPGLWPTYWTFEHAGGSGEEDAARERGLARHVHWQAEDKARK